MSRGCGRALPAPVGLLVALSVGCASSHPIVVDELPVPVPTVAEVAGRRGCAAAERHAPAWVTAKLAAVDRALAERRRGGWAAATLRVVATPFAVVGDLSLFVLVNAPFMAIGAIGHSSASGPALETGFPLTRALYGGDAQDAPARAALAASLEREAVLEVLRCRVAHREEPEGARLLAALLVREGFTGDDADEAVPTRLFGVAGAEPALRRLYLHAAVLRSAEDLDWAPLAARLAGGGPGAAVPPEAVALEEGQLVLETAPPARAGEALEPGAAPVGLCGRTSIPEAVRRAAPGLGIRECERPSEGRGGFRDATGAPLAYVAGTELLATPDELRARIAPLGDAGRALAYVVLAERTRPRTPHLLFSREDFRRVTTRTPIVVDLVAGASAERTASGFRVRYHYEEQGRCGALLREAVRGVGDDGALAPVRMPDLVVGGRACAAGR